MTNCVVLFIESFYICQQCLVSSWHMTSYVTSQFHITWPNTTVTRNRRSWIYNTRMYTWAVTFDKSAATSKHNYIVYLEVVVKGILLYAFDLTSVDWDPSLFATSMHWMILLLSFFSLSSPDLWAATPHAVQLYPFSSAHPLPAFVWASFWMLSAPCPLSARQSPVLAEQLSSLQQQLSEAKLTKGFLTPVLIFFFVNIPFALHFSFQAMLQRQLYSSRAFLPPAPPHSFWKPYLGAHTIIHLSCEPRPLLHGTFKYQDIGGSHSYYLYQHQQLLRVKNKFSTVLSCLY